MTSEPGDAKRAIFRRPVGAAVVGTLAACILAGWLVLGAPPLRTWHLHGHEPTAQPSLSGSVSLRTVVIAERARAAAARDWEEVAELNGTLSQESLLRARAVHVAWLRKREPATRLYSQGYGKQEWNYRNTAADFFAFHAMAGLLLNPSSRASLAETFEAESALRTPGGLSTPVLATTGAPVGVDRDELMFGTSEYAKDGLLSLYERLGDRLIGDKLAALVDAIIASSDHMSRFGPLPGEGAEINGNMMQLCGRLSYAMGRPEYAEFAARIASATIEQGMAGNGGLPPKFFDYSQDRVRESTLKLKDHGNEVVLGLSEVYAMAVDRREDPAWDRRARSWAEPLARMYEMILEHGVNADGRFVATMEPSPPRPTSETLSDNWGYLLCGALLFTDAARRQGDLEPGRLEAIERRVDEVIRAALAYPIDVPWGGGMDGEADAIESALYMAAYRPSLREQALQWADRRVHVLFEHQEADGTAVNGYLDGNFIRTSLLYSEARSGGWRVEPWRDDVLVGLAEDQEGNAVLSIRCTEPYEGVLRPALPRHRTILHLPWNWPRLNSWPEWFTATDDVAVTRVSGIDWRPGESALGEGVPIVLPAYGSACISLSRNMSPSE